MCFRRVSASRTARPPGKNSQSDDATAQFVFIDRFIRVYPSTYPSIYQLFFYVSLWSSPFLSRYRAAYKLKELDAATVVYERVLPHRFKYPELFNYKQRAAINPCYRTTSNAYGDTRPSLSEVTNQYHGLSTQFTTTFKSGVFKHAGLNCSLAKSVVMSPLTFSKM